MRQAVRLGLLGMSAHRLVPLIIFLLALVAIGLRYDWQMRHLVADVEQQEKARLLDRLSVEQSRLDVRLGNSDRMMLRRLVSALGLHDGLEQAYLIDPKGKVLASLSRSDLGRGLEEVLQAAGNPVRLSELLGAPVRSTIHVDVDRATGWLTAACLWPSTGRRCSRSWPGRRWWPWVSPGCWRCCCTCCGSVGPSGWPARWVRWGRGPVGAHRGGRK